MHKIPVVLALLLTGSAVLAAPPDPPVPATPPSRMDANHPRYLLFQSFFGANGSTGETTAPAAWDQAQLKTKLSDYVDQIQEKIRPHALAQVANRQYGFSIGPLTLEQSDQDLKDSLQTAFAVALERKVAVAFHFDVTHFWKFARNADGTLLSDSRGAQDNREWKDWSGTIADKDPWDNEPGLLPSMCFECAQVKALVDHAAAAVIAPAIQAGLQRLRAAGQEDLFAGVIVGWEAGSMNTIGYHALTLKGYNAATSLADLNKAQQQVLHDYLLRWTKTLAINGVPREKLYTHTSNFSQGAVDHNFEPVKQHLGAQNFDDWLLNFSANGPDSFWESFNDHASGGFSVYADPCEHGTFQAIWEEAARHGGSWAMAEGTNVVIDGRPSAIRWETYLARIFNHGGTLACIFGGFLGPGSGGYGKATESDEAAAAYRNFLAGKTLQE